MSEQTDKTSRLSRMVQSLRATQALPQSPSARTLTDVLVTLAEEILALRGEVQARGAAPAGPEDTRALGDRLAAVERELHDMRNELERLPARTLPGQLPSESAASSLAPGGTTVSPETRTGERLGSGLAGKGTSLSHAEMVRRLSMYRDTGESDSPPTPEYPPAPGVASYAPSLRDRLLLTLVPVAAIIVMIILFVWAASRLLMP